jgi:6,7-dimethyl-8-ribityllumazine synthase
MSRERIDRQHRGISFSVPPGLKLAVVAARFNEKITGRLLRGALDLLAEGGMESADVQVHRVPGAFEIPAACEWLCRRGGLDGIVTLGAVIRGETNHYDYVCAEAARGIMEVSLRHGVPVSFGVLTCDNERQALDRAGGARGNKGADCVHALLEMIRLRRTFFPV